MVGRADVRADGQLDRRSGRRSVGRMVLCFIILMMSTMGKARAAGIKAKQTGKLVLSIRLTVFARKKTHASAFIQLSQQDQNYKICRNLQKRANPALASLAIANAASANVALANILSACVVLATLALGNPALEHLALPKLASPNQVLANVVSAKLA